MRKSLDKKEKTNSLSNPYHDKEKRQPNKPETMDSQLLAALSRREQRELLQSLGFSPRLPPTLQGIDDNHPYTPEEMADVVGLSAQWITQLCRDGEITSIQRRRKGKHCIYGKEIKRYVLANLTQPSFVYKLFKKK